jgi:hypothetical protein
MVDLGKVSLRRQEHLRFQLWPVAMFLIRLDVGQGSSPRRGAAEDRPEG